MGSLAKKREVSPFYLVDQLSGQEYPLFDGFCVGRLKGDLVVSDNAVSSQHCVFRWKGEAIEIEDLGSRNGTFVGGKKIEPNVPLVLLPGAVVDIGNKSFEMREGAAPRTAIRGTSLELASFGAQLAPDNVPAPSPKDWPVVVIPRTSSSAPVRAPASIVSRPAFLSVAGRRLLLAIAIPLGACYFFFPTPEPRPVGAVAESYEMFRNLSSLYHMLFSSLLAGRAKGDEVALTLRSTLIPKTENLLRILEAAIPVGEKESAFVARELDAANALRSAMTELAAFADTRQPWQRQKIQEGEAVLEEKEQALEKLRR